MAVAQAVPPSVAATPAKQYVHAIGYLRASAVALVVAHHAVLAYHPFAPPPPPSLTAEPRWWPAFPVVDTERWGAFAAFASFNDIFLMSLLFFLSGLFVWSSLERKQAPGFLRDRLWRLGVPFAVGAGILAPLAYYPAYLQISGAGPFGGFWQQWLALGEWPAGPVWFVWVLLLFDAIAALLFVAFPGWGGSLGRSIAGVSRRPVAFFGLLVAVSALVYVPMRLKFHSLDWTLLGPFAFQTSRIFHYLAYFLIGVGIGAWGLRRGLLAPDGSLARHWSRWMGAAPAFFGVAAVIAIVTASEEPETPARAIVGALSFVFSCAASSLAFLALFLRFVKSPSPLFDSLAANSYAIYLLHYPIVNWLQYALLPLSLPAFVKGAAVTVGALGLSWMAAITIRRVPAVARLV